MAETAGRHGILPAIRVATLPFWPAIPLLLTGPLVFPSDNEAAAIIFFFATIPMLYLFILFFYWSRQAGNALGIGNPVDPIAIFALRRRREAELEALQ